MCAVWICVIFWRRDTHLYWTGALLNQTGLFLDFEGSWSSCGLYAVDLCCKISAVSIEFLGEGIAMEKKVHYWGVYVCACGIKINYVQLIKEFIFFVCFFAHSGCFWSRDSIN